jgi:uncharacterized membrane protein
VDAPANPAARLSWGGLRDLVGGWRRDGLVDQRSLAGRRLAVAGCLGAATLIGIGLTGASWAVAVDAGWSVTALVFLAWVWLAIAGKNAAQTALMGRAEDTSRPLADLILIGASVASLLAVGFVLSQASRDSGTDKGLLIGLALLSVALAWGAVHTVYTLRYGDLYYSSTPAGGIDFHADSPPDYHDLAYVALTIGMTFQVSDTDLTARTIRRTALRHALLSFLFGACIVAITINVVGSLLSK